MNPPEQRDAVGRLIGETQRLWRARMNERLRPLGLSQARWLTLRRLHRHGAALPQSELAALVGVEAPTLVGIIDGLVRDGFVSRRGSTADRRIKTIHLTAKAHRKIEQIETVAQQLRGELMQDISDTALDVTVQTLGAIKGRLLVLATAEKTADAAGTRTPGTRAAKPRARPRGAARAVTRRPVRSA
ncbi:MAG TPA: MarR family transcriptional regulator [Steroidobacteraceae bacterium]|nr:MarR family transcriptional regulator [Steroidobacteraceae bacterium]